MRIAVIGAGPAGLTAALQLAHGGAAVDVFEASDTVGGLARSIELWGRRVDLGPHRFFSTDARVNRFWLDIVGPDYHLIDRLTRIHYDSKLFEYPLRPLDVFSQLGFVETALTLCSYAKQILHHHEALDESGSFEQWVIKRFGRRLYHRFFQSYSEKLWGIPCTELSQDFAAQRIRKLTLRKAMAHAIFGNAQNQHRTLADCFAYPNDGTGVVYERMSNRIAALGGSVLLSRPVSQLVIENGRVSGLISTDGFEANYDRVISTMPITLLVRGIKNVPSSVTRAADELKFRNTILVYLNIADSKLFRDQWLYIHDSSVQVGRVTNFNNWEPANVSRSSTIICCEYWCNKEDANWTASDSHLAELAATELRNIGLIGTQTVIDSHVVRIPRSYPVYKIGYRDHVDAISNYLQTIEGLSVIGRYGSFKYNNQDHSILMGLLAAENILQSSRHNLWNLNSDVESYQEQSYISETGLVSAQSTEVLQACH